MMESTSVAISAQGLGVWDTLGVELILTYTGPEVSWIQGKTKVGIFMRDYYTSIYYVSHLICRLFLSFLKINNLDILLKYLLIS